MSGADPAATQRLRHAAETVAACEYQPVEQAKKAFAEAMLEVIAARNELIAGGPGAPRLARLNALLSLMASVEFPLGGFHRERFGATVKAMRALADEGAAQRSPGIPGAPACR